MKHLLTSALLIAALACPALADDDAPTCPGCPSKGDKAEPSSLITLGGCDDCGCKKGKKKDCDKSKEAAPSQDDCDKGCDKGKKKDGDKEDCADIAACDTCDGHKKKDGETAPAAPSQDDCGGCKKGKKKDCDKDDAAA